MCLMTVKYSEENGGETIMENVTGLVQQSGAIVLNGLLDEPRRIDGARIVAIDFSRGVMLLSAEHQQ